MVTHDLMLGDSLSTTVHHGLEGRASSRSSAVLAGWMLAEAPAAFSRVDAIRCSESTDVTSISSPSSVVGLTKAAADMVMQSPPAACSNVFYISPVSVLSGPEGASFTPSPLPMQSSNSIFDRREAIVNLDVCLNNSSSLDSDASICQNEHASTTDGLSQTNPPSLPPIRTRRKPPLSEESSVASWHTRYLRREVERRCKSSSDSINKGEDEAKAEMEGKVEIVLDGNNGIVEPEPEPESPTTPSSASKPQILECPSTPLIKSKELSRQSSLNDTKLLLTTKLKRSASIFMFDKHFEYLREIGRGSFSTVYEARDRRGGALCAVKMSKREFRGREDRVRYMREIQSVACLAEHPNVVKYFRSWQQDSHFYIQMELCEAGNLRTLLDSLSEPLLESQVWRYIEQVAAGLDHIHNHGVLHLDIKPENIFVDGKGELKIGDFGLAVPRKLWEWEEGDGAYVAPELLQEKEPGPEADMYSFGAMVYEWATGNKLPRSGPAREGQVEMPLSISEQLGNLVCSLLNPNPAQRPSASKVLAWQKAD
ncbi:unnamed protein product [Sphagnum jensenii]|uniref:Protein kinase domain-containing protein n=1 Tax=Sphagnum jensenii TaxID=128206 RepID=A0ABP0W1Y5_9BRYO